MNPDDTLPCSLLDLIDRYIADDLDDAGLRELEGLLTESETARTYFVRYCRTETDPNTKARARRAATKALEQIAEMARAEHASAPVKPSARRPWSPIPVRMLVAASVLVVVA